MAANSEMLSMVITNSTSQLLKLILIFFFFFIHASHAENGDPSIDHLIPLPSNMKMRSSIKAVPGINTLLRGRKMKTDNANLKPMSRNSGNDHHLDQTDPKMSSVQMHEELETKRVSKDGGIGHNIQTTRSDKKSNNQVRSQISSDMDSFLSCADYNGPHRHPPKNN